MGRNLISGVFLSEGLLEEITSFAVHDLALGILASSCEYVQDFWTPLLMHAPDLDGKSSIKILLLS